MRYYAVESDLNCWKCLYKVHNAAVVYDSIKC